MSRLSSLPSRSSQTSGKNNAAINALNVMAWNMWASYTCWKNAGTFVLARCVPRLTLRMRTCGFFKRLDQLREPDMSSGSPRVRLLNEAKSENLLPKSGPPRVSQASVSTTVTFSRSASKMWLSTTRRCSATSIAETPFSSGCMGSASLSSKARTTSRLPPSTASLRNRGSRPCLNNIVVTARFPCKALWRNAPNKNSPNALAGCGADGALDIVPSGSSKWGRRFILDAFSGVVGCLSECFSVMAPGSWAW
mmetsp:Transcript_33605/g.96492  ORF Transcript_33605/g.96492 Transcript_33605/m.96492 type:complete len:251 (-) Transcript_33605:502-1254(-)